jgi:hypothetical protein
MKGKLRFDLSYVTFGYRSELFEGLVLVSDLLAVVIGAKYD